MKRVRDPQERSLALPSGNLKSRAGFHRQPHTIQRLQGKNRRCPLRRPNEQCGLHSEERTSLSEFRKKKRWTEFPGEPLLEAGDIPFHHLVNIPVLLKALDLPH